MVNELYDTLMELYYQITSEFMYIKHDLNGFIKLLFYANQTFAIVTFLFSKNRNIMQFNY